MSPHIGFWTIGRATLGAESRNWGNFVDFAGYSAEGTKGYYWTVGASSHRGNTDGRIMTDCVGKLFLPCLVTVAIWQGGCRMCSSPFDGCGPVVGEGPSACHPGYRAGSILGPKVPPALAESTPQNADSIVRKRSESHGAQRMMGAARPNLPHSEEETLLGPPLTLHEIEPFVELGIPPENIISVTDRPLSEREPPGVASKSPVDPAPLPEETEIADQKSPPAPRTAISSPAADGWTRLGSRSGSPRR